MASISWEPVGRRWRVFWHVTLRNGEVDKGSRSFKEKRIAKNFKDHCEKREKELKQAVFVEAVELTEAVAQWEASCNGYTERTREHYIAEVARFMDCLSTNVTLITDLSKFHINSYLNSMMLRVKNKTVNNAMVAIKSLCRFISENYEIPNPATGIKKLKEEPANPHFLTLEQYGNVLENSAEIARPWIRFIANTGLRAAEFAALSWKNCDFENKTITIVGKGRKKRTIGLNKTAIAMLKKQEEITAAKPAGPVFVRKNGRRLSRYCLSDYIGEACRNSGLPGGGPHALRHFFATQLLLEGIPIIKVSALLGHSSITTTQRHYSHILSNDLIGITDVLEAC